MAVKSSTDSDDLITDINVTPLVDVILVLLMIFMLTASLIEKRAIPVNLPAAATGDSVKAGTLTLSLTKEGQLYVNEQATTEADARTLISQLRAADPTLQAIIAADKDVRHGEVIKLIDLVRQLGIHRFAMHVDGALPTDASPEVKVPESVP